MLFFRKRAAAGVTNLVAVADRSFNNASAWTLGTGFAITGAELVLGGTNAAFGTANITAGFRVPVAAGTLTNMSLECKTVTAGGRMRLLVSEHDAITGGTTTVASTVRYDTGSGVPVAVGTLTATPWTTNAATTHLRVFIEGTVANIQATLDDLIVWQ